MPAEPDETFTPQQFALIRSLIAAALDDYTETLVAALTPPIERVIRIRATAIEHRLRDELAADIVAHLHPQG